MSGEGEAGAAPGQDRARSPRRSGSPPPRGPPQRFSEDEREQDSYSDDAAGKPRRSLPLGRSPPPGSDPWTPRSRSGSPRRSASYSQGQSPARARGRPSPAEHHRGRRSPPPGRGGGGGGGGGGQQSDLRTIYVGGLASDTKDTDVADFFTRYGNVTNVKLIYHHDTQEFRGFGFVTFDSQRCAEEAADIGNGHEILGSRIRVNLAKYNKPPGRQQYPPHHQPRDFRRGPPDGPDGGGPPWMMRGNNMGGPPGMYPPHGRAPPPYMYPPRGPPPRSPPPRSPTPPRYPPPRHRPGEGPDADLPAPKRRRRSPSPPPRSAEVAAPPADRKPSDDAEKIRGDLLRVRSERSQAQQESAQLQLQLQELADKANNKLYDYRLKLKGAKKRSQLRGQHMMSLVEAARNVQSCHEQVKDAEKALEVAKAQLFTCISESDDYIGLERAEDEASNLDRDKQGRAAADDVPQDTAPAGPDGSLRGNTSLSGGERENQNGNAGRLGTMNESGLALKPFKISLEQ